MVTDGDVKMKKACHRHGHQYWGTVEEDPSSPPVCSHWHRCPQEEG